jgi:molecular chaperone GrpE
VDIDVALDSAASTEPVAAPGRDGEVDALREDLARARFRLDEAAFSSRRAEQRAASAEARVAELEATLADVRAAGETLAGDFERARVRARRDAEEAERKGEERVIAIVLELVDNLARAVAHGEANPATVVDGLRMMDGQLKRGLGRLGLERVDAARGVAFDPEVHEAVATVPAPEVAAGCVVDEVSSGFRMRGRLVRAARVTVAAG